MTNIVKCLHTENVLKSLKESFTLMDNDADGYLDYHEMKAALKALGLAVKKSYILSVIRMYDKIGCNKINFDDFCYVGMFKITSASFLCEIMRS